MTTQNTHHEHDDVNASVVEQQHVSEDMAAPPTPEAPTPDEEIQVQAGISASDELATPADPHAEISPETSAVSEASAPSVAELQVTSELVPQNSHNPEATTISNVNPEQSTPAAEEVITPSAGTKVPLTTVEGGEGHTRPFIDFIEEFRLAEEARLSASRQEIPAESSFELLTPAPLIGEPDIRSEEVLFSLAPGDSVSAEPTSGDEEVYSAQDGVSPAAFTTPGLEKADGALPAPQQPVEESSLPPAPPERAVSPLLRPATRLRIPRHGVRHVREESAAEKAAATPSASIAPTGSAQTGQVTSAETVTEPEQPRPPRRYRFDRPASTANGSTSPAPVQPATPQRTEESRENIQNRGSQITQNGNEPQNDGASATAKSATNIENTPVVTPSLEPSAQKQAQEAPIAETTTTPHVIEHGRRHSGQDRQKEQAVTATTTTPETVTPTAESAVPSGVVAPEDLPPLEYSELQKASTRRRRRHRTSATNGSTVAPTVAESVVLPPVQPAPVAPSAPAALAAPVVPVAPTAPNAPVASPALAEAISNQYSIVSGYTVSQMNMGNEAAGPFMGPEPSPARGSLVTREGRTTRAESQRTPIYTPGRTHEAAPSSASLNHFASVISQAIQTQTDRMVAELRRTGQSPTNVSVSLPPFPSTERVGVFVDVANLLYSARTLRMAVDFGKLLDFLRGNRRLVRAHAYCPTSPQAGDEQMFLQAVKGLGYRITTKNYKTFSSGAKKADLDLDLCMDVVRLVDGSAVDCVVLVSGDSDFMPMLDYCSDHGVRVEVAAFDEAMSATLRQSCDLFINLSMLEEIRS